MSEFEKNKETINNITNLYIKIKAEQLKLYTSLNKSNNDAVLEFLDSYATAFDQLNSNSGLFANLNETLKKIDDK